MGLFRKEHHLCMHECLLCQSVGDLSQVLNTIVMVCLKETFNGEIIFH